MKYTAAVAALVGATIAQTEGPNYFTAMSLRSASPIHFSSLTARGGKFYLGGGPPSSYCPVAQVGDACPPGNSTVLAGGNGTLALGVVVPGGQQVYVGPDGALSYTQAHSAYIPQGSVLDQFSYEPPTANNSFGFLSFESGFVACPPAANSTGYQVFGQVETAKFAPECLGFTLVASSTDKPGAWQY